MATLTQLRLLNGISGIGLVLTFVVICSPGWFILTTSIEKKIGDEREAEDHGKNALHPSTTEPWPVQNMKIQGSREIRKTETAPGGHNGKLFHSSKPRMLIETPNLDDRESKLSTTSGKSSLSKEKKHVQELPESAAPAPYNNMNSTLSLYAGLWYFMVCVNDCQTCYFSTYENAKQIIPKIPVAGESWVKNMFETIEDKSELVLLEFRCEAVIGVVFAFVGFIFVITYSRNMVDERRSGIVACLSFFLSGGMIWTTTTSIAKVLILFGNSTFSKFELPVPWCLIVGAISATFTLAVAIGLVFMLSSDQKKTAADVEKRNIKSAIPYHALQ